MDQNVDWEMMDQAQKDLTSGSHCTRSLRVLKCALKVYLPSYVSLQRPIIDEAGGG